VSENKAAVSAAVGIGAAALQAAKGFGKRLLGGVIGSELLFPDSLNKGEKTPPPHIRGTIETHSSHIQRPITGKPDKINKPGKIPTPGKKK
jgi:hypothetical protein